MPRTAVGTGIGVHIGASLLDAPAAADRLAAGFISECRCLFVWGFEVIVVIGIDVAIDVIGTIFTIPIIIIMTILMIKI